MIATGAQAATIQALGEELNAGIAELPQLNQVMAQTTEANVNLKKEYDVYVQDQKEKIAWAKTAVQQQIDTVLKPVQDKYNAELSSYSAQCASGPVPKDQYNKCVGWQQQINNNKGDIERWWENYKAKWNAANIDPINAVMAKQNTRMNEISAQMKANFEKYTKAQDRFISVRSRIGEIESNLRRMCAPGAKPAQGESFTSAERAKWCTNVDWDGASRRLPPMYKYQGTGGITAN